MPSSLFAAHNPSTVWQVPDTFRSVYSHAAEITAAGRVLLVSGQFGVPHDGSLAADFAPQCEQAMDNVEALLAAAGMNTANVVKLIYYATRAADFPALVQIRQRRWAFNPAPSVTAIAVSAPARPEYLIEIEAIAVAAPGARLMTGFSPAAVKRQIAMSDLDKIDIRVGTSERVDLVPRSEKLIKLTVNFGDHRRTILAGMRQERVDLKAEIKGRQALFVVNLASRQMAGEISEGMLFDIGYADGITPVLAVPERPVPNGSRAE